VKILTAGRVSATIVTLALAAGACSSSKGGSGTSSSRSGAAASSPASTAELEAASKAEKGLVIYANAASQLLNQFTGAFKKAYPWIKVTTYDLEDPVVFSRYAAEHGTGSRTGDVLIASAPNLWTAAVKKRYVLNYTPPGISDFPSFASQGGGLYIMSPDPAVTIYNKKLLNGQPPPKTISDIAQGAAAGKYKVATYTIDNDFGYAAFYGFVQKYGWNTVDQLGKTAKTPGDGDVLYQDVAQGGFTTAVFESGLVRGAIKPDDPLVGWEYTTDYTPLIPRGIAISAGAASPSSAKLFLNYLFSNAGQAAACDAGFEAYSNTFTAGDGCTNTLKDLYAAIGGKANAVLVPISQKVADDQAAFTTRWKQAFAHR
jgi:iron(III) transport system substrate-binding protein